jgi:hypothetical protein
LWKLKFLWRFLEFLEFIFLGGSIATSKTSKSAFKHDGDASIDMKSDQSERLEKKMTDHPVSSPKVEIFLGSHFLTDQSEGSHSITNLPKAYGWVKLC